VSRSDFLASRPTTTRRPREKIVIVEPRARSAGVALIWTMPKTRSGRVSGLTMNTLLKSSPMDRVKANNAPAIMAGAMRGKVTLRKTLNEVAPNVFAASSYSISIGSIPALTSIMPQGSAHTTCTGSPVQRLIGTPSWR